MIVLRMEENVRYYFKRYAGAIFFYEVCIDNIVIYYCSCNNNMVLLDIEVELEFFFEMDNCSYFT